MASTLFIKFLSHFYERFSMHTSVFKLVWVSLACIQVKFPYLHHKARVLIILAQGFFYWSLHFGFIWLHKGFVSIYIYFCVFISIVSPFLLSYLNSKVNEWCKLCLIIMVCKFTMMCYASLSCYVMQVYEHKASSFMLKVAFWQHVSYHISYDNLHVRLNANLWPFFTCHLSPCITNMLSLVLCILLRPKNVICKYMNICTFHMPPC